MRPAIRAPASSAWTSRWCSIRRCFNAYAIRDAEIAVEWFQRVNELQQAWGLAKPAYTIGSMAVAKFEQLVKTLPEFDLLQFFGKQRVGRKKEPLEQLLAVRGLAADCFHGGRNECFEHGVYRTSASDWDLKGAYTSALAMFRQLDWSATEHTNDLSRLAALDVVTFARVKFQFPPGTRFPSLPVDADDYGLVYPLSGESCATGPELVVALGQGATIQVIEGVVVPWRDAAGPLRFWSSRKLSTGNGPIPQRLAAGASGEGGGQQPLWQDRAGRREL